MRVLVIVPLVAPRLCPPVGPQTSAEAICGGKVILGLHRAGVEMDVIAFDQAGAPTDKSSCWNGLEQGVARIPEASTGRRWSRMIKAARHGVAHWIEWTDRAVGYALQHHRGKPYDVLYSRSLPAAAHMAGYRISRLLSLPWVANMNDPWGPSVTPNCDDKVGLFERASTLFWLRRTLKAADLVTYPSDRLGLWHQKIAGIERRMDIVPHIGYSMATSFSRSERFVLTHAGSLVSGRSGVALLEALAGFLAEYPDARQHVELRFVGRIDSVAEGELARREIADLVSCTGTVSYEESLDFIAQSTVLVLIEKPYPEGLFLPSKLCDYLAARRPILALSPAVGVVADMAARHRGFIVAQPGDIPAVKNGLVRLYRSWRAGQLEEFTPEEPFVRRFASEALSEKLVSDFESVCC